MYYISLTIFSGYVEKISEIYIKCLITKSWIKKTRALDRLLSFKILVCIFHTSSANNVIIILH